MANPLQSRELSRSYGKFQALMPTDMTLHSSEITVLLGPNGAGKTTLLLCLSGLLRPTTGTITIDGHDLYEDEREAKRQLAFMPDVPRFYTELTAWEHLYFIGQAHQVGVDFKHRAETLLREFGLWEIAREELAYLFPEMAEYVGQCKFGLSCRHDQEPGCAVRKAVMAGAISPYRYQSYMRLREEL